MTNDPHTTWLGLEGARVLVAGAGGLGSACAEGFVSAGAEVVVVDRDAERLEKLSAELNAGPGIGRGTARTVVADLTVAGAGAAVVDQVLRELGGLDILIHSVGVNDRRPILDIDQDDWDRILTVNLTTAFTLVQAAGRVMTEQGHGRIVAITSVSEALAHAKHGPYAASKGGMRQMLRVMAHEWASLGVTVNAVGPGYVETDLTAGYLAQGDNRAQLERLIPAGRLGRPDEVVGAALFLASRQASFITGQTIYVDGGRTLV